MGCVLVREAVGPCFSSSSELFHGTYNSIGTPHSFNRVSFGSGKKEFLILGSSKERTLTRNVTDEWKEEKYTYYFGWETSWK